MAHAMMAGIAHSQRWSIDQSEAEQVATAAGKVLSHYNVPGINEQTADWIGLLYALGLVYGTRLFAAMAEKPKPSPVQSKPQQGQAPTEMPKAQGDGMVDVDVPGVGKIRMPMQ